MQNKLLSMAFFFLLAGAPVASALACTTILVGKQASADGSVLVSHSDDGMNDARLVYVPAKDWEPGAMNRRRAPC